MLTTKSLFLSHQIDLGFFKRWAQLTLAKLGRYSKLSVQFQSEKDDEQRFGSDFCDKMKLEILKPELISLKPPNPWVKQEPIGNLVEFKRKH